MFSEETANVFLWQCAFSIGAGSDARCSMFATLQTTQCYQASTQTPINKWQGVQAGKCEMLSADHTIHMSSHRPTRLDTTWPGEADEAFIIEHDATKKKFMTSTYLSSAPAAVAAGPAAAAVAASTP